MAGTGTEVKSGAGPGSHEPRVVPPKYNVSAPPPPPPKNQPVPEPEGPPPSKSTDYWSQYGVDTNVNHKLKTGWKNRMCALITALDMNLSDRVKALCDVFLDVKEFFFVMSCWFYVAYSDLVLLRAIPIF